MKTTFSKQILKKTTFSKQIFKKKNQNKKKNKNKMPKIIRLIQLNQILKTKLNKNLVGMIKITLKVILYTILLRVMTNKKSLIALKWKLISLLDQYLNYGINI